ncbi:MAG: ribbon-helix-helix protein, CopG family [Hyphomicrobium sp.]
MPTVTIRLDEETDARLKRRLARSGETLSEFIREAVTKHLDAHPRVDSRLASLKRTLEKMSDAGETDLSATYKSRLREKLGAKHRR